MPQGYDVLLLGSYYCDLIFNGLPEVPRLGLDLFGTEFDVVAGGCYRSSLALKRLGLRAGWLCDFGDDLFSRVVLDMAERDGLDSGLFRHHPFPLRRVSVAFSFVHDRGFISYTDPMPSISPPVAVEAIGQHRPRAVLISHLEFGAAHSALVAAAHAAGSLVYMDCQSGTATLETAGVREAVARVDVFGPNESEALRLTGAATVQAALAQLADIAPTVVIKRGGQGALARAGERIIQSPALPVTVCDTTGAGDCFNAGFLYGYLSGHDLAGCLSRGNICGGLAVVSRGKDALPTAAQVDELMREYPPTEGSQAGRPFSG
jgi:sugar/nucleoside kinase (ribokinase family)